MVISYKVTSRVWTPVGKSKPKIKKKLQNVEGGGEKAGKKLFDRKGGNTNLLKYFDY